MAVSCPTCGKDVDPLRAPAARVMAGKILAYCSAACADQLPKAATAVSLPSPSPAPRRAPSRAAPAPAVAVEREPEPEGVELAHPPRRRRLVLWITAGIVVGGMAVAIVQATSPSTPNRVEAGHPAHDAVHDAGPIDAGAPTD